MRRDIAQQSLRLAVIGDRAIDLERHEDVADDRVEAGPVDDRDDPAAVGGHVRGTAADEAVGCERHPPARGEYAAIAADAVARGAVGPDAGHDRAADDHRVARRAAGQRQLGFIEPGQRCQQFGLGRGQIERIAQRLPRWRAIGGGRRIGRDRQAARGDLRLEVGDLLVDVIERVERPARDDELSEPIRARRIVGGDDKSGAARDRDAVAGADAAAIIVDRDRAVVEIAGNQRGAVDLDRALDVGVGIAIAVGDAEQLEIRVVTGTRGARAGGARLALEDQVAGRADRRRAEHQPIVGVDRRVGLGFGI